MSLFSGLDVARWNDDILGQFPLKSPRELHGGLALIGMQGGFSNLAFGMDRCQIRD
jgi:hypothetical protein